MQGKPAKAHPDQAVGALAARQHGVVAARQLRCLGLGRGAIEWRLRTGRLLHVHRGVYAVGHRCLGRNGHLIAAVLACGEGAVLSHRSAAALWGLLHDRGGAVDVTVATPAGREPRRGIVVHRAPLEAGERVEVAGIAVTNPARTLIDLADVAPRRALERAVDEAEYLRLDCTGLEPRRGRPGSGRLARVLATHRPGTTRTRPELEERFLAVCRSYSLPLPQVNTHVEGYEVDFVWQTPKLIVETDGRAAHTTRRAFERDRVRDAELTLAGYRVLRFTDTRLRRAPGWVAAQVRALLAS